MHFLRFLIYSFVVTLSVAGAGWEQLQGPASAFFTKLEMSNGDIIASGGDQTWFRSTDSGSTWKHMGNLPFRDDFIKYLTRIDSVMLVGTQYGFFRSEDNGRTWFVGTVDPEFDNRLTQFITYGSIFFAQLNFSETHDDSSLYRSEDYGKSWEKIKLSGRFHLPDICKTPLGLFVISGVKLLFSEDSGKVWEELILPLEENEDIYSTAVIENRIIVGTSARLFYSEDKGITWSLSASSLPEDIPDYNFINLGNKLYVQVDTSVFRSTDGGISWSQFSTPSQVRLDDIKVEGDNIIYNAESPECTIFTSDDDGATWNSRASQTVFCPQEGGIAVLGKYFYYIGPNGIYRSVDGGKKFTLSSSGIIYHGAVSLDRTDSGLFVATSSGLYFQGANSNSWNLKAMPNGRSYPYSPCYIVKEYQSSIFAADGYGCYRSQDNGNSWENIKWGRTDFPIWYSPFFTIGTRHYYYQYFFTEGDTTWYPIDSSFISTTVYDYTELNGYHFIAGNYGVSRSMDGINWELVLQTETFSLGTGEDIIFVGCSYNRFFASSDNGDTWKRMETDPLLVQPERWCSFVPSLKDSYANSIVVSDSHLFITYNVTTNDCALFNAFHSEDSGKKWKSLSNDIPYTVNRFERIGSDLYAVTLMGGTWHLDLEELSTTPRPVSQLDLQRLTIEINAQYRGTQFCTAVISLVKREKVTANLYSINGKLISTLIDRSFEGGVHRIPVAYEQLPKGCFVLAVKAGITTINRKVIVQ